MISPVQSFFEGAMKWKEEYAILRLLILETGLKEDFKWGKPCYTYQSKNILLIHGFKEYCALLFHKGALLKDSENILVQQTENVQSARQIRFTDKEQIKDLKTVLKAHIFESIEVEKAGLEVQMKKTDEYAEPDELISFFKDDPEFKKAFHELTPGRQRGYLLHFSGAKQSKIRTSRIEKAKPKILDGKGHNER